MTRGRAKRERDRHNARELVKHAESVRKRRRAQEQLRGFTAYLTGPETAELLAMHPGNLRKRAAELGGEKINGKWYFSHDKVAELLAAR